MNTDKVAEKIFSTTVLKILLWDIATVTVLSKSLVFYC